MKFITRSIIEPIRFTIEPKPSNPLLVDASLPSRNPDMKKKNRATPNKTMMEIGNAEPIFSVDIKRLNESFLFKNQIGK